MDVTNTLPYSTNEDFDELTDRDQTAELVGFIDEIYAAREVGQQKKYKWFKFVLSNGTGKRIMYLIWGEKLIQQFESEIKINRILHIDGGQCKAIQFAYSKEAQNFVPFEIIIQKNTVVNYLGNHALSSGDQLVTEPQPRTSENINEANGLITISGYIKTKFAVSPSRYENMSYGCGSITDGNYKITIQICNYSSINIEKGTSVTVTGEVTNKGGPITISCKDSSCIVADENIPKLPTEKLIRGVKTPKRKQLSDSV